MISSSLLTMMMVFVVADPVIVVAFIWSVLFCYFYITYKIYTIWMFYFNFFVISRISMQAFLKLLKTQLFCDFHYVFFMLVLPTSYYCFCFLLETVCCLNWLTIEDVLQMESEWVCVYVCVYAYKKEQVSVKREDSRSTFCPIISFDAAFSKHLLLIGLLILSCYNFLQELSGKFPPLGFANFICF